MIDKLTPRKTIILPGDADDSEIIVNAASIVDIEPLSDMLHESDVEERDALVRAKTIENTEKARLAGESPMNMRLLEGKSSILKRKTQKEVFYEHMSNQYWRLNHLYKVIDRNKRVVTFVMNEAQERLYRDLWYWNIIPKARQLGFTTFITILALDTALFNDNQDAVIIAHKMDDAKKIFSRKIKFPYENLPDEIRAWRPAKTDRVNCLTFNNNSILSVDTSARSDTISFLHISEFGRICSAYPEKAAEIVTGSLPAVPTGCMAFIESTAEGSQGHFARFAKDARNRQLMGKKPNRRQFKLHFYPWWQNPNNTLPADGVDIPVWMVEYFDQKEKELLTKFSPDQRAWYANEYTTQGEKMKQEHPTTFDEMFQESVEGAYYSAQFVRVYKENRIGKVPHNRSHQVWTSWDLGVNDATVIWFWQIIGREVHAIDYIEDTNCGMDYLTGLLDERRETLGYRYGFHIGPHDIDNRLQSRQVETRFEIAKSLGYKFTVADNIPRVEGINAVRSLLDMVWFDEKCAVGYAHLQAYRKEYNVRMNTWKDVPRHDEHSDSADAVRMFAVMWQKLLGSRGNVHIQQKEPVDAAAWS